MSASTDLLERSIASASPAASSSVMTLPNTWQVLLLYRTYVELKFSLNSVSEKCHYPVFQDYTAVTVQPQSPSHVLEMEAVFSPPPQQQGNTGAWGQDGDSGWSAILNSNPELKTVVSACEK